MENTNAPVIIVTEEKRRRKGLIWIAGGAALAVAAVGGGTFALWSDSAAFNGGTITAGDLDLRKVAETAFYDISADRDDIVPVTANGSTLLDAKIHLADGVTDETTQALNLQGHLIKAITDWRMVPGDTVAAVMPVQVHLVGDNLVAELSVDPADFLPGTDASGDTTKADGEDEVTGEDQTDIDGFTDDLTYTYTVYGDNGAIIGGYDHIEIDDTFTGHLAYFDASELGQANGAPDAAPGVIPVGNNGIEKVTVVFEATFEDTNERIDVGAAEVIGDLKLSLKQLRAGTPAIDGTTGIGAQQTN